MRGHTSADGRAKDHNEVVGALMKVLGKAPSGQDRTPSEVLVLAESLVVAALLLTVKAGGEEDIAQIMMRNAVDRATQIRALARPAEGSA